MADAKKKLKDTARVMSPGDYRMILESAEWRFTKDGRVYMGLNGRCTGYYRVENGQEIHTYEEIAYRRTVLTFLPDTTFTPLVEDLFRCVLGWKGWDLSTLRTDVRNQVVRAHCKHVYDDDGEVFERWSLRTWRDPPPDRNEPAAEQRALEMFRPGIEARRQETES